MKLENNWRQKTLNSLEKNVETVICSKEDSYLVKACNALRKKPIQDFTTEDLRIMIGQEIGLFYLMPLVIETLTNNLFAKGDMYEGDLLKNVLEVDTQFWDENKNYCQELSDIIENRRGEIVKLKFDSSNFDNSKHRKNHN